VSSTFSSLNTALTALQYNRVAMDAASGNIANVNTAGYTRRTVNGATLGPSTQAAMWSRSNSIGDGVQVASIARNTDALLDKRARLEHGNQSYLNIRSTVLSRVETGLGEPGASGVAAAIAAFRNSWHDLANNPSAAAAGSSVLGAAATLTDALHVQARNIDSESATDRGQITSDVTDVNNVATELAATNKSIAAGTISGSDVNDLLDERDKLTMRLSELTGATATIRADGGADVTINGVSLVSGQNAGTLSISSGITATGGSDGNPISYTITDASGSTAVPAGMTGEIGGLTDLLTTTLPAYTAGLDAVAKQAADEINAQHVAGYDAAGNTGAAFFSYDPTNPAASITVAITDPTQLAASGVPGGGLDAANATAMATATGVESSYQQLINGFGTQVNSVNQLGANQQIMTTQIDSSRQQLSGVSLDQETVSLVASQHAYEAASRVMSTMNSVLDTLINRMGVG
jgi:flagellar hook-associated protein 1 FlgK